MNLCNNCPLFSKLAEWLSEQSTFFELLVKCICKDDELFKDMFYALLGKCVKCVRVIRVDENSIWLDIKEVEAMK